jgi:hypothetical protein
LTNAPSFSDLAAETALNAVCALLNEVSSTNATMVIYAGTPPANADTAITSQTVLATLTFGNTAFASATASGGTATATANSIASDTNATAGTASFFRCFRYDGTTVVFDGLVGTSGADLNLNTVSIAGGSTVAVTAFSVSQPEGSGS